MRVGAERVVAEHGRTQYEPDLKESISAPADSVCALFEPADDGPDAEKKKLRDEDSDLPVLTDCADKVVASVCGWVRALEPSKVTPPSKDGAPEIWEVLGVFDILMRSERNGWRTSEREMEGVYGEWT